VTPPLSTRLLAAVLLATLAGTLSSCGRKGPLEPDPSSSPFARAPASDQEPDEGQEPDKSVASKPQKAQPRPFPLDPML
jgi:predicted small lipoprotein YifL